VVNDVSLVDGDTVIIVNATDSRGAAGRAEINVKADTTRLTSPSVPMLLSGIPPAFHLLFGIDPDTESVAGYQIDFDGDGVIDYDGDTFENMTFTYTTEGVYYPTVTVTDEQGNVYKDSIAVTVLNKEQLDSLVKQVGGDEGEVEN